MDITIFRANAVEDSQVFMTRFLNWLNLDIVNVMKLQNYVELEDMVYNGKTI